jgi:transcriptional regulator GlxA family with amidase domain
VDYINDVRIRHAMKLLRTTDAPVLDIAYACGFGNIGHFIQTFKQATGKKPLEYRMK